MNARPSDLTSTDMPQSVFVESLFNPKADLSAQLKTWNQSDPMVRFNVYRNNVIVSLIDALAATFVVTQALVGENFFRMMARVFVKEHPPKSRVLLWFGDEFADFIAGFSLAQSVPYLADVARLEMRSVHAYHAADVPAITLSDWANICADTAALETLTLALHPSVQLVSAAYPIYEVWQAHQLDSEECAQVLSQLDLNRSQNCLLFRQDLSVTILVISNSQMCFLSALQKGEPLLQAANDAENVSQNDEIEFDLSSFLLMLIQHQLLCSTASSISS